MSPGTVHYDINAPLDPADVIALFDVSGINRPTSDPARIARMFAAPCLTISARVEGQLVGVCRALTDYAYCCYLSDIAVDRARQGQGIGEAMLRLLRETVGDAVSIVLVSAPGAVDFYPKVGFASCDTAFIQRRLR